MFRLGPMEIGLIVLVVLILFGPKRLPELGKGIGEFFRNFTKGIKGDSDSDKKDPPKAS